MAETKHTVLNALFHILRYYRTTGITFICWSRGVRKILSSKSDALFYYFLEISSVESWRKCVLHSLFHYLTCSDNLKGYFSTLGISRNCTELSLASMVDDAKLRCCARAHPSTTTRSEPTTWQCCTKGPTFTQYLMGLLHFSSAYSWNTNFFEKYIRIKIEDHKILVLMNEWTSA